MRIYINNPESVNKKKQGIEIQLVGGDHMPLYLPLKDYLTFLSLWIDGRYTTFKVVLV